MANVTLLELWNWLAPLLGPGFLGAFVLAWLGYRNRKGASPPPATSFAALYADRSSIEAMDRLTDAVRDLTMTIERRGH